mmetsp:Transcript_48365/g.89025  ORF Transcript_48365/g.89025 Transcript_48365/m.89025 type:complete len:304 (+) Transcript_48365:70-981(+)
MRFAALVVLLVAAPAAALLLQNAGDDAMRVWSATGMRPDVAARMLGEVELKWVHGQLSVLMGDATEESVHGDIMASCDKLVKAIAQGSGGESAKVTEYMEDVCEQSAPAGYDNKLCIAFANGCAGAMTDDVEYNRDSLNSSSFCNKFLNGPITDAAKKWQEVAEDEEQKRQNATTVAPATTVVTTAPATEVVSTTEAAATEAPAAEAITAPTVQEVATNASSADSDADSIDADSDDDTPDNATLQVNGTSGSNATDEIAATLAKLKESQALKAKVHRHRAHLASGRKQAIRRLQEAKGVAGVP